jgi:hypothetical protein
MGVHSADAFFVAARPQLFRTVTVQFHTWRLETT